MKTFRLPDCLFSSLLIFLRTDKIDKKTNKSDLYCLCMWWVSLSLTTIIWILMHDSHGSTSPITTMEPEITFGCLTAPLLSQSAVYQIYMILLTMFMSCLPRWTT